MYKVVVDRSHAMVNMEADGFIAASDLEAAAKALHAAIRSLGDRVGRHVTLYDLTGLQVAAPKVLETFGGYFTRPEYRDIWARRVALVTRSPMVTRQMARLTQGRTDMRIFEERRVAVAWLLSAPERLAAEG